MADVYRPRIVDAELDELIGVLPAIALDGAKGVGKTVTARRRAGAVHELDVPGALELYGADPGRLLKGRPPVLIDEWQRLPASWDLVRRAVDEDRSAGRFVLTGSATPPPGGTHSGAGRIVTVRMRPLTLAERGVDAPSVSLAELLQGGRPALDGTTTASLADYAAAICQTGFPGFAGYTGRGLRSQLDGYVDRVLDRDVVEAGHTIRAPDTLRRWLSAYAAATATATSYESIRDAATPGHADKPAKATVQGYRDLLERLWILDPLPAWLPTPNHLRRLAAAPRHHLVDPGLAARLLGADVDSLLGSPSATGFTAPDGSFLGQLFESRVSLDVRVYAQAAEARVGHLRTFAGDREIDLIVERPDRRVLAIEVKLARSIGDHDVRHLHWLKGELADRVVDALVVTTGADAYRRADGIGVVPAALLGP